MRYFGYPILLGLLMAGCGGDDGPAVPGSVGLVFPENNSECITGIPRSETTSEVEFQWMAANAAVRYELNVVHLQDNVVESVVTSGLSASLVLDKGAAYSWQVVATNQDGQDGPASPRWQFFNAGSERTYPPFPALLKEPGSGESVTADANSAITLIWDGADADDDLVEYEIYFGAQAGSLPVVDTVDNSVTSMAVPVNRGTVYYWEILSRDAEGNTSRSGVSSFRVL